MDTDRLLISLDNALRTLSGAVHAARPCPQPADGAAASPMSPQERRAAGALMRANHVGEVCAQALYQAQALTARDPALRAKMALAARDEVDHLAWTQQRLAELGDRASLLNLIEGLTTGRLLEVFEKHYADDVVMSENGLDEQTRKGKDVNREYETYFANNAEWHGVKLGPVVADGHHTAYEMWMDFTINGQRVTRTQWAVQTWNDAGQIARETFYYAG